MTYGKGKPVSQRKAWRYDIDLKTWSNGVNAFSDPDAMGVHSGVGYQKDDVYYYMFGFLGLDDLPLDSTNLVKIDFNGTEVSRVDMLGYFADNDAENAVALTGPQCGLIEDQFFVLGGFDQYTGAINQDVFVMNITTYTWTKVTLTGDTTYTVMGLGRTFGGFFAVANVIIIFGGKDRYSPRNDVLLFDTDAKSIDILHDTVDVPEARMHHSTVAIYDTLVMFGGMVERQGVTTVKNDMWSMVFTGAYKETWLQMKVTGDGPPGRRHSHCAVAIGRKMYLFGGADDQFGENPLNDLWVFKLFDDSVGKWESPMIHGDKPSGRYGHSCAVTPPTWPQDPTVYVFGGVGQNPDEAFQDLFAFDCVTNSWSVVTSGQQYPSYWFGLYATAVFHDNFLYVLGGRHPLSNEVSQDLLRVPVNVSKTYPPIWQRNDKWRFGNLDNLCAQYTTDGPCNATDGECVWCGTTCKPWDCDYKVEEAKPFDPLNVSTGEYGLSKSCMLISGDRAFFLGGNTLDNFPTPQFGYFDLNNLDQGPIMLKLDPEPDYESWVIPNTKTGAACVLMGDRILLMGGKATTDGSEATAMLQNDILALTLTPVCAAGATSTAACHSCFPGSYRKATGACEICPAGTYCDNAGQTTPTSCPKGFYNPFPGGQSFRHCFPCEEGFFAAAVGATSCTPCATGKYCPLGAAAEQLQSSVKVVISSSQPALRVDVDTKAQVRLAWIICGILGAVILVVGILLIIALGINMFKIDIFFAKSASMDAETAKDPMKKLEHSLKGRRTSFGGVFSLFTIVAIVTWCTITIIPLAYNPVEEVRGELPGILLGDSVPKEQKFDYLVFNMTLDGYFTDTACTAGTKVYTATELLMPDNFDYNKSVKFMDCAPGITMRINQILTANMTASENPSGLPLTQRVCVSQTAKEECTALFICKKCQIVTSGSPNVQFDFYEQRTYARNIFWEIQSVSGYPGRPSRSYGTIVPADSTIFRGLGRGSVSIQASQVFFTNIHKVFFFGYITQGLSVIAPASVPAFDFDSTDGVFMQFTLQVKDNIVEAREVSRVTVALLISALSGAALFVLSTSRNIYTKVEPVVTQKKSPKEILKEIAAYIASALGLEDAVKEAVGDTLPDDALELGGLTAHADQAAEGVAQLKEAKELLEKKKAEADAAAAAEMEAFEKAKKELEEENAKKTDPGPRKPSVKLETGAPEKTK
eukprot:gb/GEZN01000337.1/.p1 GENE.gb/GEZN01000337.1/~~gb/GEZN01000337.1/.p1  ORF type:complete len:1411 (-),score=198.93 gb/GEZN01000337.1/:690-4301(-)